MVLEEHFEAIAIFLKEPTETYLCVDFRIGGTDAFCFRQVLKATFGTG